MKLRIKQWWNDFKTFDWKMYLALCLLALVPAIYQTVITGLITTKTSAGSLDIVVVIKPESKELKVISSLLLVEEIQTILTLLLNKPLLIFIRELRYLMLIHFY